MVLVINQFIFISHTNTRPHKYVGLNTYQVLMSIFPNSVSSKEDGASSGACYYLPSDTAAEMTRKLKGFLSSNETGLNKIENQSINQSINQ